VPTRSSVLTRAVLPKLPSMAACDKELVSPGKRPHTLSSLPSGTSRLPLATRLRPSMERKAPVFLREWLITHNPPTDRTHKCTSRTTKHGLGQWAKPRSNRCQSYTTCVNSFFACFSTTRERVLTTLLMVDVFRDRVAGLTRLSQHLSLSPSPWRCLHFQLAAAVCFFYLWVF
jgi:hypothetical protein